MPYTKSVDAALAYLSKRVLDEAWVKEHDDVAYYFKAPLTFLEAGATSDAEKVLSIAARYVEKGGVGSKNGAYDAIYPHYPWMWICLGAVRLNQRELAESCWSLTEKYAVPSQGTVVVKEPYSAESAAAHEEDFFATAARLKMALLLGRAEAAEAAGNALMKVLEANKEHMQGGRFYLRWRHEGADLRLLRNDEDPFCSVNQKAPGQLYFMVAFPAMALLELSAGGAAAAAAETASASRTTAMALLEFLKGCEGVYCSSWSHKFALASAMVGDFETSRKIADYLVSLQQAAGNYQEDPEALDSVDQTAEIAVWLQQINRLLSEASSS